MCGVVCYLGPGDGVRRVQEALHLLEYRAADSAGLAALAGATGELRLRRAAGPPQALAALLASAPLFGEPVVGDPVAGEDLLRSQGLEPRRLEGRDLAELYRGLRVGAGDLGSRRSVPVAGLSRRMEQESSSPDLDRDAVRHAFRLLAAHVAAPAEEDLGVAARLDEAFLSRVPDGSFPGWREAWMAEFGHNAAGQAFAAAVGWFQERFPGLERLLGTEDRERIGGATAAALPQVVLGHGRLAVAGEPSEANAHPFSDRSRTRAVCENGTHAADLYLPLRRDQERWWRARGVREEEAVHRSQNTSEVLVYEWERTRLRLDEDDLDPGERRLLGGLEDRGIDDPEEQALRLTLDRVEGGSAHACAFYSRRRPGVLYVSSHRRPIAVALRSEGAPSPEVLVASDLNAALMLWSGEEVDQAADRLAPREASNRGFPAVVWFLDGALRRGRRLLATVRVEAKGGSVRPAIRVTNYEGDVVDARSRTVHLSPELARRPIRSSFAEEHLLETPEVVERILAADELDEAPLTARFGSGLERLDRVLLVGEGSSWRAAQAMAPTLRRLLSGTAVNVYRPVELLNVGATVDPEADLAVEVSWSGTTASVLEVDDLLDELGAVRLAVTGRPHGDLGRRVAASAGLLDTRTGVEVSVATMKSYPAALLTGMLLAARLARAKGRQAEAGTEEALRGLPGLLRRILDDRDRAAHLEMVGERFGHLAETAVVGSSPVDWEGALKIAKLTEGMAVTFGFGSASVRALVDRAASGSPVLFVVNASDPDAGQEAGAFLDYLAARGVPCVVHAASEALAERSEAEAFLDPSVSEGCRLLTDHGFFSQLALALARGRGTEPGRIDRPRNLVKSVTGTGVERRVEVERRRPPLTLERFLAGPSPSRSGLLGGSPARLVTAVETGLAASRDGPEVVVPRSGQHLTVTTDTEAAENGVRMAAAAWQELMRVDVMAYRRFASFNPAPPGATVSLRIVRSGSVPAVPDPQTISVPTDLSPLEMEAFTAARLTGLAIRSAGRGDGWWEAAARVPAVMAGVLADQALRRRMGGLAAGYVSAGYDKVQVVGGGQDYAAGRSMARCLRMEGFLAESVYTDSVEHGSLVAVGGPEPDRDALVLVLATDPLFRGPALGDALAYRARGAPVALVVPAEDEDSEVVADVGPVAVYPSPELPRLLSPFAVLTVGAILTEEMGRARRREWSLG